MSLESVFKLSLIMNMIDNLTEPMSRVTAAAGGSINRLQSMEHTLGGMTKGGIAMEAVGEQIASAVLAPVEATFETRRALGELSSLGVKDLGALEDAARSFSDQWAGTSKSDFISAAYDIKSGIASLSDEGVAQYTELSGVTAKATKSTIGQMTDLFATGYGIYKGFYGDLSDMEFGEMFSAGIATSVKQFKTDGSQMAGAIKTLGASATTAQVPLEEQLSILGMLQATMSGAEAGTKYKAFLRSATKGGEALGLSFTDANNQLLSMPEILDQLQSRFGETMDAAEKMELQKAFGDTEAVALIDLMYSKTGDLQDNILSLYGSMGQGTGAAAQMATAINETEPEKFQRLQQQIHNVTEDLGNSLLPTVNSVMEKVGEFIEKGAEWIQNHQELVRVIMLVVLGLGGFLMIAGSVITVVGGVGLIITKTVGAFRLLKSGFGMAKAALSPLISSVWSFTAALLANPVTWIVIGIIALIAGIILLYNKCEWFRNLVDNVINFVSDKLGAAFAVAKKIFSAIGNIIGKVMGAAKATVEEKLGNMKRAYEEHGGGIKGIAAAAVEGIKGFYMAGFTFLDNLTGGRLSALTNRIGEKFSSIKNTVASAMSNMKQHVSNRLNDMKSAYEKHGGGLKGAAAAAMEGIRGACEDRFNAIDKLTGGKLSAVKSSVSSKLSDIRETVASSLEGAKQYAASKLEGMRTICEQQGGGMRGAMTAAMWGIQSVAQDGFNFVDNLTGGRLSTIRDKFFQGIQNIKNVISEAFSWFRESGRKILTTFTEGIKSAISFPVSAVKNGLQKIRNMLPFSDAKTGPLSTLTLSGHRTMTTYASGIQRASHAPAGAAQAALEKIGTRFKFPFLSWPKPETPKSPPPPPDPTLFPVLSIPEGKSETAGIAETRPPVRTIDRQKIIREKKEYSTATCEKDTGISINDFQLTVDFSKIKELPMLLKFIREVEDYVNANHISTDGEGVTV